MTTTKIKEIRMNNKIAAVALTLAGVFALAACGAEQPEIMGQVATGQTETVPEAVVPETPEFEVEIPEVEAEPVSPTFALGEVARVGDWDVRITDIDRDATRLLLNVNQYNDPPRHQYVLVTYEATYWGDSPTGDAYMDLMWDFVGTDNLLYEETAVVNVADDEDWPEDARRGGTVTSQHSFDVPGSLISGGSIQVRVTGDTQYVEFLVP